MSDRGVNLGEWFAGQHEGADTYEYLLQKIDSGSSSLRDFPALRTIIRNQALAMIIRSDGGIEATMGRAVHRAFAYHLSLIDEFRRSDGDRRIAILDEIAVYDVAAS